MKTLDYEPFESEWEKEMMKWTKPAMIDHLKTLLKERLNTDALLAEKDKAIEAERRYANQKASELTAKEAELEALRTVFQMMAAAYNDISQK